MIAAQESIEYFNTEYPCKLFENERGPCENFDIIGCDICFKEDGSKNNEGVIIINKDTDPNVDVNELQYGNRLQTYYKYVTTKQLPPSVTVGSNENFDILTPEDPLVPEKLLNQTPVYLQKTDMIRETMLFIFLDQGHDFHVAGERGNTMWTGVKKASTTMVYRSGAIEHEEEEEKTPASKSDEDDTESYTPDNSSVSSIREEDPTKYIEHIGKPILELARMLGVTLDSSQQFFEILYPYKNEYRNFAINTSFSGDIGIFGVMYMNTATYDFLKEILELSSEDRTDININTVLNAMNITYHIELNSPYGCIIQIRNCGDSGITHNFHGSTGDPRDMMNVTFLPFVGGSIYNQGMHSIWDFNEPRYVYLITLNKLIVKNPTTTSLNSYIITAEYGGKLFFQSNLNIPTQEVDLNLITSGLTNTNVKSQTKEEKELKSRQFENILLTGNIEGLPLKPLRGTKYQLSNLPDKRLVLEFVFEELIQPFYSKYSPNIHPDFTSLSIVDRVENTTLNEMITSKLIENTFSEGKQEQILISNNIEEHFFKQIGFINDTAVVPSDNHYCKAFNSTGNIDYPYKFSVVSGPVDGSGQGGQITPEYHPPEIDVYMVVFNPQKIDETGKITGGELMGIIARLTFTRKILSNTLNSKNNSLVELHYVYIDVSFLNETEREDLNLLDVNNYPKIIERLLNFALMNTIIINDNGITSLKLRLLTGEEREERLWFKYFIETVGPSVSSLNSKIIQLTKTLKFINDIKRDTSEENIIDFLVNMENKDNTNKLLSFVLGDEIPIIDTILRVAQNLYNTTRELWNYFEPDIKGYPIDGEEYTRNLTFERVFIIRNKYIGDKSRSTDCLFMNK